ncbi:P2X purinoceptor 7-like [Anneissia japonica]|uniref:P2X purinoceptor 7-like n=1 Tax=Anneissia japonica TaxID=1529436 RepID=UPI0014256DD1|nr:P2X purinoceptor 7-like [Anneissia japonica]
MEYGLQPYQLEPVRRDDFEVDDDVIDNVQIREEQEEEWRKYNKEWCECQRCGLMPTAVECLCCHEIGNVVRKMNLGLEDELKCIVEHFEFEFVCLHPGVIRTALVARHDVRRNQLVDPIPNETFRLKAYRQFTYWVHDRLGKAIRRVIPACVVGRIRQEYPSDNGAYVGFKEADLQA